METRSETVRHSRRAVPARHLDTNGFAVVAVLMFVGLKLAVHGNFSMHRSSLFVGLALIAMSVIGMAAWRAKRT